MERRKRNLLVVLIGIVIVGHFIWLAVLYSIGGILSGRKDRKSAV